MGPGVTRIELRERRHTQNISPRILGRAYTVVYGQGCAKPELDVYVLADGEKYYDVPEVSTTTFNFQDSSTLRSPMML